MSRYRTVSRDGSRSARTRGNEATSSLVPMHATTASGATATPKRRPIHVAAASRYAGAPMAAGYPVAAPAASARARRASSGIGSTGGPTEQPTMPPGTASAVARRPARRSCGYGGGTNPVTAMNPSYGRRCGLLGPVRRARGIPVADHELPEPVDVGLGDAGADAGLPVAVHLDEHVAFAMQRGDDVAPVVRDGELHDGVECPQPGGHDLLELLDPLARRRRHCHRLRVGRQQIVDGARVGEVDLVHDEELGPVGGADLAEDGADGLDLLVGVGSTGVDDVHEHVDLGDLLQRRAERLDELVREAAYESDGVADERDLAAAQLQATRRRIERREQAVLDESVGARQPVQQGRLACVGVADERHGRELTPPASLALRGPGLGETLELGLELVHAPLDATPVHLELGLARAPGADAAGLLAQLDAAPPQPRQPVSQLRQLDLHHALLAVGVLGEDVEDQGDAVDDVAPELLLEVALLRRRQLVVEHDDVD